MGRIENHDKSDGAAEPLRRYTNAFDITFSISEVDLRFGQTFGRDDDENRPVIHSWLVTTPVHLGALKRAIDMAMARYSERFGPIPGADDGTVS